MVDTKAWERGIVATLLLDAKEHEELLLAVRPEWFNDDDLRQVFINLREGHEAATAHTGTRLKFFDIALLIKQCDLPNIAYGYAEQLKEEYLRRNIKANLDAVLAGGDMEAAVRSVTELLSDAQDSKEVFTIREALMDAADLILKAMDNKDKLIHSPFSNINELVGGLMPGRLITIAGRPGTGKSAFVLQMVTSIARRGSKVVYVSLEMLADELAVRLLSNKTGISSTMMVNGKITADQFSEVATAAERLKSLNLFVTNQGRDVHTLERLIRKERPALLVIDSLNLMRAKGESERVRIMSITRALKEMAIKHNIPIIMIAQLSRAADEMKLPTMSALKESGSIEEDSDVVILLSDIKQEKDFQEINEQNKLKRGEYFMDIGGYERVERAGDKLVAGIVAKNRNGATGKVMYLCHTKRYEFVELPEREIGF